MVFEYERYKLECLDLPASAVILYLLPFLGIIFFVIIKMIIKRQITGQGSLAKILVLLFVGFLLGMNLGHLVNGGRYLWQEDKEEAVCTKGVITEIEELGIFSLPRIECDYYEDLKFGDPQGYEFTINGIQCTAPAKGTLAVGDYVEVEYLPKSGYILYINEMGEE